MFTSSDLTPSGTLEAYDIFYNSDPLSELDLNLYSAGGTDPQNFTTTQAAFTGSMTGNFAEASFRTVGTTGDIIAGDQPSTGAGIGQWKIVPEPSTISLVLVAAACGVLIRRRIVARR